MKATAAIKNFLNTPGIRADLSYEKVQVSEIRELKQVTSAEEWQEFGRQAASLLGEEFEEA